MERAKEEGEKPAGEVKGGAGERRNINSRKSSGSRRIWRSMRSQGRWSEENRLLAGWG